MPVDYMLLQHWGVEKRWDALHRKWNPRRCLSWRSIFGCAAARVFLTMANQEREVLGLSNPVVHDTDMAVRVGVEALKKLIAQDRMTKL